MKRKGFTLVEMLAVIAVLGILVLVVLPNVLKNFREAKRIAFLDEAKTVYTKATDKYVLKRTQGERIGLITNDNNQLDLDNAGDLEYSVRIDSEGQVTSFRLKNDEFCIVGVGDFLNDYKIDQIIDLTEVDGPARCVSTNLIDNAVYTLKLLSKVTTTTGYEPKIIFLKYNVGWYKEKVAKNLLDKNINNEPKVVKPYLKDHYYKGAWATNMNGMKIKAIACDGTVVADNTGSGIFTGNEDTTYVNAFSEFTKKYYQVAYAGGDNSIGNIGTLKVLYGDEKYLPKNKDENGYGINIKKIGYLFTGWKSNNVFYEDEAPLPVITDDNENSAGNSYYKYDNEIVCRENLEIDNTNIKTFDAEWQAVVYNITYDYNNGSGNGTYPSTGTYDQLVTVPNPVRTGYTFTGWTIAGGLDTSTAKMGTTADVNALSTAISGTPKNEYYKNLSPLQGATVTFKANWSANKYTIAYEGLENATVSPKPVEGTYDITVEIGNAVKTGYTFLGWTAAGLNTSTAKHGTANPPTTAWSNGSTKVTSNHFLNLNPTNGSTVTLTTNWKTHTYTVKYNCNGGSGSTADSSHIYDVAKKLTKNGCSRTGYTYKGWSKSSSASTATYSNEQSVVNLTSEDGATVTLYAVWKDEAKPTCTVAKSNTGTTSGVTTTVSCSDNGSGCKSNNPTGNTGLKSNKTYTVYDNAGNSNTCSVTVTSQIQKRTRTWNSCKTGHNTCRGGYPQVCVSYACREMEDASLTTYLRTWTSTRDETSGCCIQCHCSKTGNGTYDPCFTGENTCRGGWNAWSGWSNVSSCSSSDTVDCRTLYN